MITRFPQSELDAAMSAARRAVDATGYGHWVGEEMLRSIVAEVIRAIEEERRTRKKIDPNLIYPTKDDTNIFPEEDE